MEESTIKVILDSSFLIKFSQNEFSAWLTYKELTKPFYEVKIPKGVRDEYERIARNEDKDNLGFPKAPVRDLESLLMVNKQKSVEEETKNIVRDKPLSRRHKNKARKKSKNSSRKSQYAKQSSLDFTFSNNHSVPELYNGLSEVDCSIIEALRKESESSSMVGVASYDIELLHTANDIVDNGNLIEFSQRGYIPCVDEKTFDGIFIHERVFEDLSTIEDFSKQYYLAVYNSQEDLQGIKKLGFGICRPNISDPYDVFFERRLPPSYKNVDYIPINFLSDSGDSIHPDTAQEGIGWTKQNAIRYGAKNTFALSFNNPYMNSVVTNSNPLTERERSMLVNTANTKTNSIKQTTLNHVNKRLGKMDFYLKPTYIISHHELERRTDSMDIDVSLYRKKLLSDASIIN